MHNQHNSTQDSVRRAQIAIANRLIAEQSATIARAHSAIERAMETLRGPDGDGPTRAGCEQRPRKSGDRTLPGSCHSLAGANGREARKERLSC
jgi:hypothetical protein